MKVLVATPLFPPEIGEAAVWAKQFAHELSQNHEVTIVAYGRLPEKLVGVHIATISKDSMLFWRIMRFTQTLWQESRGASHIYAHHVSTGIPAIIVGSIRHIPVTIRFRGSESRERRRTEGTIKSSLISVLEYILRHAANSTIDNEYSTPAIERPKKRYAHPSLIRVSTPLSIEELGYSLDAHQPHIDGERKYFGTKKSVLFATRIRDHVRVVIKISSDPDGKKEMERERTCRNALESIGFAYGTFYTPKELYAGIHANTMIVITEFITQEKSFLERPLDEQYSLSLTGLQAQEQLHAVTRKHMRDVRNIFEVWRTQDYITRAMHYITEITLAYPPLEKDPSLHDSYGFLREHSEDIERYTGFLTHFDFMPQNFRVHENHIYLLDHSSLRFGNKHESWARFMNFMVLYNHPLERKLNTYVLEHRAPEEYRSLKAMRVFRLLELIAHHARIYAKTDGDMKKLSSARVQFWTYLLRSILKDIPPEEHVIETYRLERDRLRSPEENRRQEGLH